MSDRQRRVLLLGAGLVAPPVIDYLLDHRFHLTIAANNPQRARALVGDRAGGTAVDWSIADRATLERLVGESQLTISLLPAPMHAEVAAICVGRGTHLVTASYVQPEMRALDQAARAADVLLLNELGVDPGIDHMTAMQVIDRVRAAGGRVTEFRSYCGGLPAPDANDNPWGYKFSWSPLGVLLAATSGARYRVEGALRELTAEQLFSATERLTVGEHSFEGYPNRDSLAYIDVYGLGHVQTMLRGTLRWPGWEASMVALASLGLLSKAPPTSDRWPQVIAARAGLEAERPLEPQLLERLTTRFGEGDPRAREAVERLRWLGLLDGPLPSASESVIGALAMQMTERMSFAPGERDMLAMQHRFVAEIDGREQRITSTMVAFGDPAGYSAMAKTVGLPVAIGARLLLEGALSDRGVQIPVDKAFYEPILSELATVGIEMREEIEP